MQSNFNIKKAKYKEQYGKSGNEHIHPLVFSNEFSVHRTSYNSLSTFCYNSVKALSLVGNVILKAEIDRYELYNKALDEAKESKTEKMIELISDVSVSKKRHSETASDKIEEMKGKRVNINED